MPKEKGLDLKIVWAFIEKYTELEEKGEISEKQLEELRELIDKMQEYSPEEFTSKLKEIFPAKGLEKPPKRN